MRSTKDKGQFPIRTKRIKFVFQYMKQEILNFGIGVVVFAVYDKLFKQIPFHEYPLADDLGRLIVYSIVITSMQFLMKNLSTERRNL